MSPIIPDVPRSSTGNKLSNPVSKFNSLTQIASQYYCQAECPGADATVDSDGPGGRAITAFDVEVADVPGTVLVSPPQKKDNPGNTGKRPRLTTDKSSDHHNDKFACTICGQKLSRHVLLLRHVKGKHSDTPRPFNCSSCTKTFKRHEELMLHQKKEHTRNPPRFSCHFCEKSYRNPSSLSRHIRTHDNELDFGCDVCKKRFKLENDLRKHTMTHACNKNKPLKCKICCQGFVSEYCLDRHLEFHRNGFKYKCDQCKESFTHANLLARHQTTKHKNKKLHQCPACQSNFTEFGSCLKHIRSIHKDKQETIIFNLTGKHKDACSQCPVCKNVFLGSKSLLKHMRTKHRDAQETIISEQTSKYKNENAQTTQTTQTTVHRI